MTGDRRTTPVTAATNVAAVAPLRIARFSRSALEAWMTDGICAGSTTVSRAVSTAVSRQFTSSPRCIGGRGNPGRGWAVINGSGADEWRGQGSIWHCHEAHLQLGLVLCAVPKCDVACASEGDSVPIQFEDPVPLSDLIPVEDYIDPTGRRGDADHGQ